MLKTQKILLLDDDQDLLELYKEILSRLPSQPEIHTATSGAHAIAILESETFQLLISDLSMPKMDGLQVLTIVRRKFPGLRTAVLTCVMDEEYRARAYSMGIDLFLEKPNTSQEINFFLDCIESLLGKPTPVSGGGFRGVQNKSLADIIQLECLSLSSSGLKISNGLSEGRIYIQSGEVIDAVAQGMTGEEAFKQIMSWETGNFVILPPDPTRKRTIFTSCHGLLLASAQSLDEQRAQGAPPATREVPPPQIAPGIAHSAPPVSTPTNPLIEMTRPHGAKFALEVIKNSELEFDYWGLDEPEGVADWIYRTTEGFKAWGETLQGGGLVGVKTKGNQHQMCMIISQEATLCVGFQASVGSDTVAESLEKITNQWTS